MIARLRLLAQSRWLLPVLLAACILRLWVMPMTSSFWVDEMATFFVVHHGASDATLRVAPQVSASIYYALPRAASWLFGFSEWAYRLPSLLALILSLYFIARLTTRLIHREATWFVIFCCLAFRPFDYEAADARPYALGTCVVCASLWFLIRWLDAGRLRDAACFVVTAALVCQVQMVFWPMYLVYAAIAGIRLVRREARITRLQLVMVTVLQAASLAIVILPALSLLKQAGAHVVATQPSTTDLTRALKLGFVTAVCAVAAIVAKWRGWTADGPSMGGLLLVAMWWLVDPLSLFAFSHLSGNSVFLPRYLSVALPGAALVAAGAAAVFLPANKWRPLSVALGAGVLLFMGNWTRLWPAHHNSGWREASAVLNKLSLPAELPVICPSPFIEARPPVWRADYPIDSFLYSHLLIYHVPGKVYPFPFELSDTAERSAERLWQNTLSSAPAFVLFGGDHAVAAWREFFRSRSQTAGWHDRGIGNYGDVSVVMFEPPAALTGRRERSLPPMLAGSALK